MEVSKMRKAYSTPEIELIALQMERILSNDENINVSYPQIPIEVDDPGE